MNCIVLTTDTEGSYVGVTFDNTLELRLGMIEEHHSQSEFQS